MLYQQSSLNSVFEFSDLGQKVNPYKLRKRHNQNSKINQYSKAQTEKKRFYFKIGVIRKIATFIEKMKHSAVLIDPQLKPSQYKYLENNIERKERQNLLQYQNKILLCFQFAHMLLIIVNLWVCSFQITFAGTLWDSTWLDIITFIFHICYFILHHNTESRTQNLQTVSNRYQIFMQYLATRSFFDVILILTLTIRIIFDSTQFLPIWFLFLTRIPVLLLYVHFSDYWNKLKNILLVSSQTQSIFGIIKLIGMIFCFIHVLDLTLNIFSNLEKANGVQTIWIQYYRDQKLQNISNIELYIEGWYWISTIISTVGFGQIVPANIYEKAFISIIEIVCCVAFGYFVNYIGTLIGMIGQSKASYQKDLRTLNFYLKGQSTSDKLKNSIRAHYANRYKLQQDYSPQTQKQIFEKLTHKLKENLIEDRNNLIIQKSKLTIFPNLSFLHKIAVKLNKVVYSPDQIIYQPIKKQIKLWLIQEGKVNETGFVQSNKDKYKNSVDYQNSSYNKIISIFDSATDNSVGWINFIKGLAYKSVARAQTFTIAHEIQRDQVLKILSEKQHLKQFYKFHELRQTFIVRGQNLLRKCLGCDRLTHNAIQCPRLHFKPKSTIAMVLKQNYRKSISFQSRSYKNRRNKVKVSMKSILIEPVKYQLRQSILSNQSEIVPSDKIIFLRINDYEKNRTSLDAIRHSASRNSDSDNLKISIRNPNSRVYGEDYIEQNNAISTNRDNTDSEDKIQTIFDKILFLPEDVSFFDAHLFEKVMVGYDKLKGKILMKYSSKSKQGKTFFDKNMFKSNDSITQSRQSSME